jgi:hypothetical protein
MPVDNVHEPHKGHLTTNVSRTTEQENLQHTEFHPISKSERQLFLMEVTILAIHFSSVKTTRYKKKRKNHISSH